MTNIVRVDIPHLIRENDRIGTGISSWVLRVDAVAKCYTNPKEREREIAVYERLGQHKTILPYYGTLGTSVLLQFAPYGTVRRYLENSRSIPPTLATRLLWAKQATEAISFLHSKAIFHCDISYNNIFLDTDYNALVGDFAGSSIDDKEPLGWYGMSHCYPDIDDPSVQTEIFALGSTFYEIMVGKNPFEGRLAVEVERAIRNGDFPSLDHLPALSTIILKCWLGNYSTVDELLQEVEQEGKTHSGVKRQPYILQPCIQHWSMIGLVFTIVLPLTWWVRSSGLREWWWAFGTLPTLLRRPEGNCSPSLVYSRRDCRTIRAVGLCVVTLGNTVLLTKMLAVFFPAFCIIEGMFNILAHC